MTGIPPIIHTFDGLYDFLSNFYPCEMVYEGIIYPSSEHAYQAAKTLDIKTRKTIAALASPAFAKKKGRAIDIRPDWEEVKLGVMLDILRIKFAHGSLLAARLVATYPAHLVEGNFWGDRFWGVCKGVGENHLGKILMQVREELRDLASP